MLAMDKVYSIRQLYYEQGKSIAEIIEETGHDRKTIVKYLDQTDFNLQEPEPEDPEAICPKLDAFKPVIDGWLMEDRKAPRKQRHTAHRVFKRLEKEVEGFNCSYRLVAQYVAYRKKQMHLDNKKGFIPLIHHPGECQADFGAANFYENSLEHEGKYLVLSFPYSNAGYPQLMYGENAECLMEGMIAIFKHIGGVPTEIWFDNTSAIVIKILKNNERALTDKFLRFSAHYGFRYKFMNPDSGNEKGNVENKVNYSRNNFLVPVPRFINLSDYNRQLLKESDEDFDRGHYRHEDTTIEALFEEDKKVLLPLPDNDFDCARYETAVTDKWGRFTLEEGRHEYSVSPEHACDSVRLKITSDKVIVMGMEHHHIVTHKRLYGGHKQSSMDWIPYLTEISRKPRSLFNSGIYDMMPAPMQEFVKSCSSFDRSRILKILAEQTKRTGFDSAVNTVTQALTYQVKDPDSLQNLYRRLYSDVPLLPPLPAQERVPAVVPIPVDLSAYDAALKGGAANG
ncbi:MAG: IS21 family transposase [Lachnospiraceae bacterium]|nr:IS21 family transposase [Lachnospiraceae bacterium]